MCCLTQGVYSVFMKSTRAIKNTSALFSIVLKFDSLVLNGSGETMLDALRAIRKPIKITTKSTIAITHGEKKFTRVLTVPMATRLFYPAAQIYHARNFSQLLK